MARQVNFVPGTVVSSGFLNDRQEVESSLHIGVRLTRASSTQIELPPLDSGDDSVTGQSSLIINGQPRWWSSPIIKTLSGAKGTYSLYVVAGEELELTAANFTLTTGAAPANSRKIGEVDWSGAAIEAIRQNGMGSVTGAMLEDGALAGTGDLTWAREPSGAWVPTLKAIGESKIADGAITSRKAKLTAGVVVATGDMTSLATNVWTDVTGASLAVTSTVASKLLVTGVFNFWGGGSSGSKKMQGGLKVDEAVQTALAECWFENLLEFTSAGAGATYQLTVAQTWAIPLTAANHTIKLAVRDVLGGTGRLTATGTRFSYLLIAS